jgi:hypothetical protein
MPEAIAAAATSAGGFLAAGDGLAARRAVVCTIGCMDPSNP